MRDLYDRLKAVGFDKKFLQETVLPDWWEDTLAEDPHYRSLAESAVCTYLGYKTSLLNDPHAALPPPPADRVLFKRNRRKPVPKLLPALHVVRRAASVIADSLQDVPEFDGRLRAASEIRSDILQGGRLVDFASLIDYCWSVGVPVIRIASLPRNSVKFDAIAVLQDSRPVIALVSGRVPPPWLAFHLAHELGHISRRHIPPGAEAILDGELEGQGEKGDDNEIEADRFACELLTGKPDGIQFRVADGITGADLGRSVIEYLKRKQLAADPGAICLFYCRSTGRWPIAQKALESLGVATGGPEIVSSRLSKHLREDTLSDSAIRFLQVVCDLPATHAV